ncbi:MAG TPA: hypothetical protein VHV55_13105 [Pirellulales bacterium]|jgi:hypothetical protein|nr:hypothetical protein [Pirellulales bacterium]
MQRFAGITLLTLALACAPLDVRAAPPVRAAGAVAHDQPLPIPPGPLDAVAAALERPPGTPAFPYGVQSHGTQAVYDVLRVCPAEQLDALERAIHRQPTWLRQLTAEVDAGGFDPHAPPAQVAGARLLWQLVPYQYPPLESISRGRQADTTSTAFYDPISGVVSLSEQIARWPRAVSLLHEAMHAQQSAPGTVTWAMLIAEPRTPRTWLYSAMRDNPRAMDAAVELGPSLASGLAIVELYHRCLPKTPELSTRLVAPSGRSCSVEWMLRQAHLHGMFGDTPLARSLGAMPSSVAGINELLGESTAGRQFVKSLVGD